MDDILSENNLVADKLRAEEALRVTQEALAKATIRLEQQKLQIATLSGRGAALKMASEEASVNGKRWDIKDVRRFAVLPNGPPDFVHDALRELLDLAVVATQRRVHAAVTEGTKARSEADKADAGGDDQLEAALAKCKSAEAEHALRTVTRDMMIRNSRCTKLLRVALKRLEEEATAAQATHASDIRSVTAKLVAQRDAVTTCVLDELQRAETEGAHSMRGMQEEIARLQAVIGERDGEIAALKGTLGETQGQLKEEKRASRARHGEMTEQAKTMRAELEDFEGSLSLCRRELATHTSLLFSELALEEEGRSSDAEVHQAQIMSATAEAQTRIQELQTKIKSIKVEARTMHANLSANFRSLERDYQTQQSKHALDLQSKENEFARERNFLRGKIDSLGKKLLALRASNARGRSMLYWSSMKDARSPSRERSDKSEAAGSTWKDDEDDEDGALFNTDDALIGGLEAFNSVGYFEAEKRHPRSAVR